MFESKVAGQLGLAWHQGGAIASTRHSIKGIQTRTSFAVRSGTGNVPATEESKGKECMHLSAYLAYLQVIDIVGGSCTF